MTVNSVKERDLNIREKPSIGAFLTRWEMILVYLLLLINAAFMLAAPELFFSMGTVQAIIRSGMDLSFMVLGMTLVLIIGEIDVSVASIMIVSCTVMGKLSECAVPDWLVVLAGLAAGGLCGAFNGILVAKLRLPSVVVTIATSLLFRGVVQIVLDVNTLKTFPKWFSHLAWQDAGNAVPYSLITFLLVAAVFAVVLHKTKFGRQLYILGNNATTALYSGLPAARLKIAVFTFMGITAALSGVLFAGRLGGVSSGMGTGYELQVIAIAVLGGVSTKGGKGNAIGPIIATFIMAFLTKTLDLMWIHANVQQIIIGAILLIAVLIPAAGEKLFARRPKTARKETNKTAPWRRIVAVAVSVVILAAGLFGCSQITGISSVKGSHVFMFKNTGNAFGDLMYEGFAQVAESRGEKAVYKSPAEPSVAAQVEMLDTLLIQQVASITISTSGDTGYEEIFKRAKAAGVKIVSVDNMASPDYRTTHVNECDTQAVGSALVQAATLISLGIDYPEDGDMESAVVKALSSYTGKELVYGVLSSAVDTPVQNGWIRCMQIELQKPCYAGKVNPSLDIKYGNDEPTESTNQANAFVAENKVDMIISPTTVGVAAAGQVLKSSNSHIRLTGLGLPHEMQGFMPTSPQENAFDFVCPYMLLWDVRGLGAAAGAATMAAIREGYTGTVGETFSYNGKTYQTLAASDGGSRVIALDPYVFHKGNMADWIDVL